MPGKSKKGGGLTSSPVYKKQAYGTAKSPFTMKKSPAKQIKGSMPKSFNIKGDPSTTPGYSTTKIAKNPTSTLGRTTKTMQNVPKQFTKAATTNLKNMFRVGSRALLGTGLLAGEMLYSFGKQSIKRKKAGKSGFNIAKPKKNKGFNF